MASFDGAKINAEQALIPAAVQSQFGADATVQDIEFVTLTGSVGYGYSLIGGNFFLTARRPGWLGNQRKNIPLALKALIIREPLQKHMGTVNWIQWRSVLYRSQSCQ